MHGVGSVRETKAREHPVHHAESAVGKTLQIQAEDPRIELSAPNEVTPPLTRCATISGGREGKAFEGQEKSKEDTKNVETGEHGAEDVEEDPKIIVVAVTQDLMRTKVGAALEKCREDKAEGHAVVDVFRHMARLCLWSIIELAWQELEEEGHSRETDQKLDSFHGGADRGRGRQHRGTTLLHIGEARWEHGGKMRCHLHFSRCQVREELAEERTDND